LRLCSSHLLTKGNLRLCHHLQWAFHGHSHCDL
jgi:hypothetical protein